MKENLYFSPRSNTVFKYYCMSHLTSMPNVRNFMTSSIQYMNEVYNMFTRLCVSSHCTNASAVESQLSFLDVITAAYTIANTLKLFVFLAHNSQEITCSSISSQTK